MTHAKFIALAGAAVFLCGANADDVKSACDAVMEAEIDPQWIEDGKAACGCLADSVKDDPTLADEIIALAGMSPAEREYKASDAANDAVAACFEDK